MKVVMVQPFDAFAGSQRVFVSTAQVLQSLGHGVDVQLGFGTTGFVSRELAARALLDIDRISLRKALYPIWMLMLMPRLLVAVMGGRVLWMNTVHAFPAAFLALCVAPRRVVLHLHEIEFPRIFDRFLRWALRRGAHVVCVSAFHRDRLGLRAIALPNPVAVGPAVEPARPPLIVFVGAVNALKGFPLFLDVFRALPPGRVRGRVCVPLIPKGARAHIEEARALGLEVLVGETLAQKLFDGACLTLQCTDPRLATETFSLVAVESLSCGVPVATAGLEVAQEVLGDAWAFNEAGREPARIAERILSLVDDEPRMCELRAAALRRRELFAPAAFSAGVQGVLRSLEDESLSL